jgi:hypothetical protein
MSKEKLKYWKGHYSGGGSFIGLEVGRFVRWHGSFQKNGNMDTRLVLRNEDGDESSFWSDELTPIEQDKVSQYNAQLKSHGFPCLPDNPEPVKTLDELAPDFCWCHVCGNVREKRGTCPRGCVELRTYHAREWQQGDPL